MRTRGTTSPASAGRGTPKWKRFVWDLHGMMGFWTVGFILVFGITGVYLGFQSAFTDFFEYLEPLTEENASTRVVDRVMYWLAYLHFGRFGGRFPGCSRQLCDTAFKIVWAVFGLAPIVMFVTGALMWWNRVVRKGARQSAVDSDLEELAVQQLLRRLPGSGLSASPGPGKS